VTAVRAEQAESLQTQGRPKKVRQLAETAEPLAKKGKAEEKGSVRTFIKRGENADYLTSRIARDRPDILEKMKQGKYVSVRAWG
jgi:hypothetical protein